MKKMIIIILFVAELSSWATRSYMIRTAEPDTSCRITWQGETHISYEFLDVFLSVNSHIVCPKKVHLFNWNATLFLSIDYIHNLIIGDYVISTGKRHIQYLYPVISPVTLFIKMLSFLLPLITNQYQITSPTLRLN